MKLRYICLLGLITLIRAADDIPVNVRVVKTVSSSISSEPASASVAFETSHKRTDVREFETAHKITNERPIIKLLDDDDDLMQQQNPQNLLSTKERPELNPVLSALINEDVMKSIESKRAVEESVTVAPINTLTTSEQPLKATDDDVAANVGLVDQAVNLDEAGSETNQKSRIQIKKGPNGQDYEYEYVYYYYDEDEKNDGGKAGQSKQKVAASEVASARESSTRGKSRYTNIDRSTTSAPDNELGGGRGRGRANANAASSDVEEGRLPQNTRFPPRSRGGDVTPAPEAADERPASGGRGRTGVKRPSLDLVDSDSFNTDEKQVKSNRNIENELSKKSSDGEDGETRAAAEDGSDSDVPQTTDSDVENTTPLMEKAALDLYAIIANENFNMDATTGDSVDVTTTDVPTTNADELTTIMEEEPTTTTTTTTTTPEPTTTTTTTTTTTPAPGRRGGLGGGSRNRFRLKNGASTTTTTEAPAETGGSKSGGKTKGRFGGRPSFGSGRTPRPSKEHKEDVKEEVNKEESKPSLRGKTRNRFNLRGASTTEKSTDENTIESKPASTTTRSRPARPSLNLRGRGRPGATSTPASTSESENNAAAAAADGGDKPTQSTASVARPSRFNLGRPGAAGGANRLLPRGRVNPLKPAVAAKDAATAPAEEKPEDENTASATPAAESDAAAADGDKAEAAPATQAGGLNRLKNRPKIQVTQKTAKASAPVIVRKPNPLIGRRRIGASSTTEAPADDAAAAEGATGDDDAVAGDENDPKDEAASDAAPQIVEIASEQPARGLGLLANRRRLGIRKPGTLN